jgi:carbonic anhydrase
MSATDQLLKNNETYAADFDKGELPLPPGEKMAVVRCMDGG